MDKFVVLENINPANRGRGSRYYCSADVAREDETFKIIFSTNDETEAKEKCKQILDNVPRMTYDLGTGVFLPAQ